MAKHLPKIISYSAFNHLEGKVITVNEKEQLAEFPIQRIYWINYFSPEKTYSEHAHKSLQQIIVAVHGEVKVSLEGPDGFSQDFILNDPSEGLYIPPMFWKKIEYIRPCILLCLASESYNENDYIRSYEVFKQFQS